MSSAEHNMQEELSEITEEILRRTDYLKERTKKNEVIGESDIIKGIIIFEEVVKRINPTEIDENVVSMIIGYTNIVLFREEEKRQHVNNYVHLGINNCYFILDNYLKHMKPNILVKKFA